MSDLTKPNDVADLFVDTCRRLRDMGATRVEGFGLVASFTQPQPAGEVHRAREERDDAPKLSPEEAEMARRLKQITRTA